MAYNLDFRGEPKELAYRKNIEQYLKIHPGNFLPRKEYWTLAHDNSWEVSFLEDNLLLYRSQFHGVNDSTEIIEACRVQYPGAVFHLGSWFQVLDRDPICPHGGLVYLDLMDQPDIIRPVASSLVAKTLERVGPGTVVCANLCAQTLFKKEVPLDTFYTNLWSRVDRSQVECLGSYRPQLTHSTQMLTLFFVKRLNARGFASVSIPGGAGQPEPKTEGSVKSLYPWQDKFSQGIVSSWRSKIIAPTGSGKTLVIQTAALRANDTGHKTLIVVPQRHIAEPFVSVEINVDGEDRKFRIKNEHLFLGSRNSALEGNYAQSLASWIRDGRLAAETAITSTATLVRLIPEMETLTLDDVLLIQDEAHHISGVMAEDEECSAEEAAAYVEEGTNLGDFYEHILKNTKAGICLVSATHFRGDGLPMFLEKASEAFDEYNHRWEDHWKWLGLKSFNYDCIGYSEPDVSEVIVAAILAESSQRHIVCVPSDTHRFRKSDPNWIQRFLEALRDAGLRVLDLVTTVGREDEKKKLFDDNEAFKKGSPTNFDVVVACNMMREGTDWVPATRVHDLAPSPSLLRTTQTIGRLMRKDSHRRKVDVAYRAWFRNLDKNADKEEIREHVADRANVALATMVMAENFFGLSPGLDIGRNSGPSGEHLSTKMTRVFGDSSEEIIKRLVAAVELHREDGKITDRTISIASVSVDIGDADQFEAMKVLRAYIQKLKVVEENTANISPALLLAGTGLDPSILREEGFDYTVRSSGLLSFETGATDKHYIHLREVATPLRGDQAQKAVLNKRVLGTTALTKAERARARKAKAKFPQLATSHSSSVSKKIEN